MNTLLYLTSVYVLAPVVYVLYGSTKHYGNKLIKNISRCKCRVCEQYKDPIHD